MTLEFPVLLSLIEERSAAFRAAAEAAPDLKAPVPTCPEWTLQDLVRHLGLGQRRWAAVVGAGPSDTPPATLTPADAEAAPADRETLLAWSAESTRTLVDALHAAGPDGGCWTWWGTSQSPRTAGAVARHQVQEAMVHTYDAQLAAGDPQQMPGRPSLDGVDEFLATCCATTDPWPYEAAALDFHATEGRSWRLWLSADGARAEQLPKYNAGTDTAAKATFRGTAAEIVLVLYGRNPIDSLAVDGDPHVFEQLRDWEP